jgi:hypothetical protein
MLEQRTHLNFNTYANPRYKVNCTITMLGLYPPIDYRCARKYCLQRFYYPVLVLFVREHDTAARDVLNLCERIVSRLSLSTTEVVDFAGRPVGSNFSSRIRCTTVS